MKFIKELLFIVFIMGISVQQTLAVENENCNCSLTENAEQFIAKYPPSVNNDIRIKDLTSEELKLIRNKLCMDIITATNFGFEEERFKKVILDGLEVNINDVNANAIVSIFLNKYKQELVCPKDKSRKNSRDLHIYKTAVRGGVIELFDEILLENDEYDIDLNAYEIVEGKKETIVDYIEKMIESDRRDNDELELLKDDIIEAGGKRGSEL